MQWGEKFNVNFLLELKKQQPMHYDMPPVK